MTNCGACFFAAAITAANKGTLTASAFINNFGLSALLLKQLFLFGRLLMIKTQQKKSYALYLISRRQTVAP